MQILSWWAFVVYTTVDFNHPKNAPSLRARSSSLCPTSPERLSQTVVQPPGLHPMLERVAYYESSSCRGARTDTGATTKLMNTVEATAKALPLGLPLHTPRRWMRET
jgi:hypothetical protein